jgi:chaperonin cofactor prefoldin
MKKGKYQTNIKFLEFVGGKGNLNFISNEATVQATYLSGLDLNGIVFKLTIYDDSSVDFDEVDTNQTSFEQRQRLLSIIEDKTTTSYRNRNVIQEIEFESIQQIKGKNIPLYLSVDFTKPIDKLGSLIDDVDVSISDDAMNNLDTLINSWLDEEPSFVYDEIQEITNNNLVDDEPVYITNLGDSFTKLKKEKYDELKKNKDSKSKQLSNLKVKHLMTENEIKELESDIQLLDSRIENLGIETPDNGYYFFVSERMNEEVSLDSEVEKTIRKVVSKVKSINVENFMKLFKDGEFHIKIGMKIGDEIKPIDNIKDLITIDDEFYNLLPFEDLEFDKDYLILKTDLTWGKIVNKMVNSGFSQDPQFDEMCGSNSYQSKTINN